MVVFAFTLWWATQRLVTGAEDTAERQLRAYVYAKMVTVRYPPNKPDRIGINFEIRNGGQTWARNVLIKKAVISREFGIKYDPWDRAKWEQQDEGGMVFGPDQVMTLQLSNVALSDLPAIVRHEKGFDFAIWITYEDILSDPPVLRQFQLSQRLLADEAGGTAFEYLPTHNCADDDCPKD